MVAKKKKEEALLFLLRGPHNKERWKTRSSVARPSHSHHLSVVSSFQNKQKNTLSVQQLEVHLNKMLGQSHDSSC